jgi:glutathione S-transferase
MKLYGLKCSYFTGKLESYFHYKEIPHEFKSMTVKDFTRTIPAKTGAMQMPAVELDDGRWMTDTSPIIDWLETQYPEHPILPDDPVQAFICRLIEDYADEWLWRSAMHYRWSYPASAKLLARQIVDEMTVDVKVPAWLKRNRTEKRQFGNFVLRDGVNDQTRANVEQGYKTLLKILNNVFASRRFVFGDRPTLADIGLMGPLFRHFAMDPTPGNIMRETAPGVIAWVYRVWNARASRDHGQLVSGVPDDLLPLIKEIGETHLEALCANVKAWSRGESHYDVKVQGAPYTGLQTSQYRVWCLEMLQKRFKALDDASRETVSRLLDARGALEPLLRLADVKSGYDEDGKAPFGHTSLPVFKHVKN